MHGQLKNTIISWVITSTLVLAGCQVKATDQTVEQIANDSFTQAAQTIIAELTQVVPATLPPTVLPTEIESIELTPTPTDEPLPPTSTPVQTNTPPPTVMLPPTESPTMTVLPTETSPAESNYTLAFHDDFSSGRYWPVETEAKMKLYYSANGYVMENPIKGVVAFSVRGDQYADVRVEVVGSRISGPHDGYYGVICHFSDASHYYLFAVSSDGWYGIAKRQPGDLVFIQEGNDTTAIYTGNAPNIIRGDCAGGALTLWVNGHKLLRVEDSSYSAGAVGMALVTRSDENYVVIFDDFEVYAPE